jgi:NAD(P)H-flavin reductase/ferredoxin
MKHTVRIAGSGLSFECDESETLLDAADRARLEMPYSCRTGVCGSCEGTIEAGEYLGGTGPTHGVKFCRTQPRSDLVIRPREARRLDADSHKTLNAKVYQIARTGEVAVLRLRFPAGTRVRFRAGQYLRVALPDGEQRSFSMANPAKSNDGVELHVRHLQGGRFSEQVFNSLKAGDLVRVTLPFGDFYLRESPKPIVFVAGGTGFAPIKSVIESALDEGSTKPMTLYWGARTADLLYLKDLPAKWCAQHKFFAYVPVVSDDANWNGRAGLVHRAVLEDLPSLEGHQAYVCGAPAMVAAARNDFVTQGGLPAEDFFCDAFAPSARITRS